MTLFYTLTKLFIICLNRICWILIPASAFDKLFYITFVKVYEETPASERCVVGKQRGAFLAFSYNYR